MKVQSKTNVRGANGCHAVAINGPARYSQPDLMGKPTRQYYIKAECGRCGKTWRHIIAFHRKRCDYCGCTAWLEEIPSYK